ncbi:MAG: hypothetical protein ACSHXF_01050 [Aquaticitalea sp.]
MNKKLVKRNLILGILFFLPVVFLLFLYPAQHNYNVLETVEESVLELNTFSSDSDETVLLKDHITVIGFLGKRPMEQVIAASNLKELVYDKFMGFKKFQVVMVMPKGTEAETEMLRKEIHTYEQLKYWHFVFADDASIKNLYASINSEEQLDANLATSDVFIIDKDLNQRGRIDDRTDPQIERDDPIYPMLGYNSIEVAEIKNKLNDDMRILFTEYRQKRKGKFDSTERRANDLKEPADN